MSMCTSGKCEWKKTFENNEYVKIVKAEFRKTEDPVRPVNFEPGHSSFDTSVMKDMLRRGLQEVHPQLISCDSTIRGGEELFTSNHKSVRILFPYSLKQTTNQTKLVTC